MNAEEYLNQIRYINNRQKQIALEIMEIETKLGAKAISYDLDTHSSSGEDKMAKYIYKLIDLKDRYAEEGNELIEKKGEVIATIRSLNDFKLQQVLYLRYVSLLKWEEISDLMGYEERWCKQLRRTALEQLDIKMHTL